MRTQHRDLLQSILASLEEGVFTVDRHFTITFLNKACEEITGWRSEEVLGRKCYEVFKSSLCKERCLLARALQKGKPERSFEVTITNKQGQVVPVDIQASPLRSQDGEIAGGLELMRDLTKYKGLRESLRRERDRIQLYLTVARVIILELDKDCHVKLINKMGCDLLAWSSEEIVGKNWIECFVPQRHRQRTYSAFRDLIEGRADRAEYIEYPLLCKDGTERIIFWHNTVQRDRRGRITGTLSSGEDITERKQVESELIRSEKLAALGHLAAAVAHEVNNPLSGILLYSRLLLKKHSEGRLQTEQTAEQLRKIQRESERASRIIRNLLDCSRQSEPHRRPVEVNKVVEATLSIVGHQVSLENVRLQKRYGEGLSRIMADFDQIQQALANIILNAVQAMPQGGDLTITTALAPKVRLGTEVKDAVRISVCDTGVGIPQEYVEKIFNPFFSTKEKGKGVGLGLSVVYRIVDRHKGKIEVASNLNGGTTFTLYFEALHEKEAHSPGR